MPARNQYKHHYLLNLPESELQALAERCRDWQMHPAEFARLVSNWFKNFSEEADCALALKVLHAIEYYSEAGFNELLEDRKAAVLRYLLDHHLDIGRIWFAVPEDLADSAVRHAHPLSKVWKLPNERFVSFGQIGQMLGRTLGAQDTLILFNDTHGSGKQFMREVWPQVQPLLGKVGAVLIVGAAIADEALALFKREALGAQIIPNHATVGVRKMKGFTGEDVSRLAELGRRVYPNHPQGFGGCGLLLAYHFQCPNNSLPLIWADGENNAVAGRPVYPWKALFPYRAKTKAERGKVAATVAVAEPVVGEMVPPVVAVVKPVLQVAPVVQVAKSSVVPQSMPVRTQPRTELDWASAAGEDDIGRWAEIKVGKVVQRFRYVPAGKFMMGSLDGEEGREDNEGPQHRVTISQGFWLADTACTQAMWLEVMAESPSYFNIHRGGGPEHPVENVSWYQVQDFLQELGVLLPSCIVTLPTEAEWEYACRAGSDTPFSFGGNIATAQVNYDGNYPYGNAKEGEFRECTVPVKALPANAWGLYQMHGNVLEWCADEPRTYEAVGKKGATDPGLDAALAQQSSNQDVERVPPLIKALAARVQRGGGWHGDARGARSAYRGRAPIGMQYHDFGFRLALRARNQTGTPEA